MKCGDPVIDGLLAEEASVPPFAAGSSGISVGYLQELLRGHGYASIGDPREPSYGVYGPLTSHAVLDYRRKHGLTADDHADSRLLRDLIRCPAPNAVVGPAYLPLILDVLVTSILRFVWLTSLFETAALLGVLNLNTDQCGVSFGVLQWSQRPGQLHVILDACCAREPAVWQAIMGGSEILDHTAKPNGGVDAQGHSIDPAFELTEDPWKTKLQALGASPAMQRVQIAVASQAYSAELARVRLYAHQVESERGFAFLLDLANQFGVGGLARQYKAVVRPGMAETAILRQLEDNFTGLARPEFRLQVRARREFFRTTSLLSDHPLKE